VPEKYAYRTDSWAAITAFRATNVARAEFGVRLRDDAAALGGNNGPLSNHRPYGGPEQVVGLDPDGSGAIPHGWRIIGEPARLTPAPRGKGSAAACRWLEEHQPGPDLDTRHVLKKHGLAYQSRVGSISSYTIHLPMLFEHDGYLWACYLGEPDGDFPGDPSGMTWPEISVEDFEAAKNAHTADRAAGRAAA
jgi:hypothetical protein